jgi:hypothetical protein
MFKPLQELEEMDSFGWTDSTIKLRMARPVLWVLSEIFLVRGEMVTDFLSINSSRSSVVLISKLRGPGQALSKGLLG